MSKLSNCKFKSRDRRSWWGEMPVFAWGRYDGQLKRAIALMKYHNHPELGIVLGELLAQAWLESDLAKLTKVSVIPIPLHHQKIKERGVIQAEKIAQGFCQSTGYSLSPQALIRIRETQAMFDLSPEARIKNLQSAFRLTKKLPKHPVLLLDDIYTVGTTVNESAKILRRNKINVIGSVVVAKASSY
ncbi:MAG: ComF family protein [Pleurocapsa sp.]